MQTVFLTLLIKTSSLRKNLESSRRRKGPWKDRKKAFSGDRSAFYELFLSHPSLRLPPTNVRSPPSTTDIRPLCQSRLLFEGLYRLFNQNSESRVEVPLNAGFPKSKDQRRRRRRMHLGSNIKGTEHSRFGCSTKRFICHLCRVESRISKTAINLSLKKSHIKQALPAFDKLKVLTNPSYILGLHDLHQVMAFQHRESHFENRLQSKGDGRASQLPRSLPLYSFTLSSRLKKHVNILIAWSSERIE